MNIKSIHTKSILFYFYISIITYITINITKYFQIFKKANKASSFCNTLSALHDTAKSDSHGPPPECSCFWVKILFSYPRQCFSFLPRMFLFLILPIKSYLIVGVSQNAAYIMELSYFISFSSIQKENKILLQNLPQCGTHYTICTYVCVL